MELEITALISSHLEIEDERALVERARHDRSAFAALYRRHYSAIARYVQQRTGDAHAAEDLASDVFLAALKGLPKFRHRDIPIRAWLYRIATNVVNRWAKRKRRAAVQEWRAALEAYHRTGGALSPGAEMGTSLNSEPTGGAIARESQTLGGSGLTGDAIRKAMLTLSPKHQAALALHYLEGLSIVDVAAALGCREGTVKSRLSRGRDALRGRLDQWRTPS